MDEAVVWVVVLSWDSASKEVCGIFRFFVRIVLYFLNCHPDRSGGIPFNMKEHSYWVYMMCSDSGTLYVGVTNNLHRRVFEHKNHLLVGFSQKYDCTRLVYAEEHYWITQAIEREKQIKNWNRRKKIQLIKSQNPLWKDLYYQWQLDQT